MSVLNKLTEGIVNRDLKKEGDALLSKWERTGLLEGLDNDTKKNGMARLLENQAKELLREAASTMAGGDVQGFASVAFPIVRRVFGGLIANDLVSVQPMSLPSGLIFFLDFTYGNTRIGNDDNGAFQQGKSIYGGNVVASQITGGISLTGSNSERGFYSLNNGYASPTGSMNPFGVVINSIAYGTASGGGTPVGVVDQGTLDKLIRFDPDLSGSGVVVAKVTGSSVGNMEQFNVADLISFNLSGALSHGRLVRRLTQFHTSSTQNTDPSINTFQLQLVFQADSAAEAEDVWQELSVNHALQANFVIDDNFQAGGAVGSVVGATAWALENTNDIPEINIKVDSVAVTAMTKKLKAKWTPELGQDLNAYHNLDAEVELTSILSEQIALEIDQEILSDLINGASAGTLYWSRAPGLFVNRETGLEIGASSAAPDFTGSVSEWYETLLETVNDVSARIHRKTLRGGANFIVTSPEIASILEFTAGFRAAVTVGEDRGTAGAMKVGSLSKKLDVYVDPYFPRNLMLVGRRGNSFLESGYVYAPYVPLQVTPTIFGVEDFVPRKGVMTRYAKKMVRPDMYGLVVVRGLIGEAGATS
tara:strand:- start:451 stop:2220 length:1770 start_codon:yes stop_codon:yes gene_type:complete